MKKILFALLAFFSAYTTFAQKNAVYLDAGVSLATFYPGLSVTYNYRPVKFLGVGIGVQAYDFYPTITGQSQYIPAIFGDVRFNIRPMKKDQFFVMLNVGKDFYHYTINTYHDGDYVYNVSRNNGVYTGLGVGYFNRITKHGGGPYASLKMIFNAYSANTYNIVTQEHAQEGLARGTLVVAIGFKF